MSVLGCVIIVIFVYLFNFMNQILIKNVFNNQLYEYYYVVN